MPMLSDQNMSRRGFLCFVPAAFALAGLAPLLFRGPSMRALESPSNLPGDLGLVADPVIHQSFDLGGINGQ